MGSGYIRCMSAPSLFTIKRLPKGKPSRGREIARAESVEPPVPLECPVCQPTVAVESSPPALAKKQRWPAGKGYTSAKVRLAWMLADPCAYCGEPSDTWDHIAPRKRGGNNEDDNFARACFSCNAEKTSRTLLMFLALRAQRKQDGTWKKRQPMSPKFRGRAGKT